MQPIDWMQPHFATAEGKLVMSVHALVIDTGSLRIVVDTCIGNDKERNMPAWNKMQTSFLEDLTAAGYPPETIDVVMCTHLHVDHVGWNTRLVDGEWVPTFTNARYLMAEKEWKYWDAHEDESTYGPVLADSVRPIVDAGLSDLVSETHEICSGVVLEPTPGHTPGHVSVHITSQGSGGADYGRLHSSPRADDPHRLVQQRRFRSGARAADPRRLACEVRRYGCADYWYALRHANCRQGQTTERRQLLAGCERLGGSNQALLAIRERMNSEDKRLGMDRAISRRDFLEGSLKFAAGAAALSSTAAPLPGFAADSTQPNSAIGMRGAPSAHPPGSAGLRGSHAGAFEVAHELAWAGRTDWGESAAEDATEYDLVVVGGGVSGLSAAYFYQQQHPDARILILDNHDDFGGHAKRNEFAWGDRTILGYGGSQSLEAPGAYSDVAKQLLRELAVDVDELGAAYDQNFYSNNGLEAAIYFDKGSFGRDVTVRSKFFEASGFLPLAESSTSALDGIAAMPLSDAAKAQLGAALTNREDRLPDHSVFAEPGFLSGISYQQFFTEYLGVTDPDAWRLIQHMGNSYFGHGMDMVPAMYALGMGLPGMSSTGMGRFGGLLQKIMDWGTEPYIYHFPDGNASIARLLVRRLIPGIASGSDMYDVVTAPFDYAQLDQPDNKVRLRLNSTVVNVAHNGDPARAQNARVQYVQAGAARHVSAKRVVLACYNMAIPHLCPELPARQKEALAQLVKIPMCSTNVLLRNWHAIKKLGIGMAYSPGRWNKTLLLEFPVTMGDYQFANTPDDPIMLHSLRGLTGAGDTPEEQSRAGRYEMLSLSFTDYEREIRRHLEGMLSPGGFDPAEDIAGITVNRWPHGYAWDPNPLFYPEFAEGEAPHEVGRQPFGRIRIANSDAGARAYLDCAIDEAWRAVNEF